jgi:hypothetical protein
MSEPALYFLAALLVADFLSGLAHWFEDRYGNPAWPVLGPHVIEPNIRHHVDQMAFTGGSYWHRNWTSIVPAGIVAAVSLAAGQHFLALIFVLVSQANEIHSWAHQRCSRPIRGIQLLGVCCSPEQHARHHRRPFAANFCTMTDFLNPLLEAARFWPGLEALVHRTTGIAPRPDRQFA